MQFCYKAREQVTNFLQKGVNVNEQENRVPQGNRAMPKLFFSI